MRGRYRETMSSTDKIADIEKRLENLERISQLGASTIGNGQLTVAGGDIVIKDASGEEVMRINSGTSPEIKFTPLGEADDYYGRIISSDSSGSTQIELSVRQDNGTINGGKVLIWGNAAVLSHQPTGAGLPEAYIAIGKWPVSTSSAQTIYMQGRFLNERGVNTKDAYWMGSVSVGSGFSGLVYSYPYTYEGTMIPIVSIESASVVSWCLTDQDNDGFTVSWSDATAKTVNFACFRLS